MGFVIVGACTIGLVGRNQRQPRLVGEIDQSGFDPALAIPTGPAATMRRAVRDSLLILRTTVKHFLAQPGQIIGMIALPSGAVSTRSRHVGLRNQSSVISWSSKIMYVGTFAIARRIS